MTRTNGVSPVHVKALYTINVIHCVILFAIIRRLTVLNFVLLTGSYVIVVVITNTERHHVGIIAL